MASLLTDAATQPEKQSRGTFSIKNDREAPEAGFDWQTARIYTPRDISYASCRVFDDRICFHFEKFRLSVDGSCYFYDKNCEYLFFSI